MQNCFLKPAGNSEWQGAKKAQGAGHRAQGTGHRERGLLLYMTCTTCMTSARLREGSKELRAQDVGQEAGNRGKLV